MPSEKLYKKEMKKYKLLIFFCVEIIYFFCLPFFFHQNNLVLASATGTWQKEATNPVLSPTPSSWDADGVYYPNVILDGSTYKMWYQGYNTGTGYGIGYATSSDGITWTKYAGNPVMVGDAGKFDGGTIYSPSVIKDGDTYKMWYAGTDESYNPAAIGYATSSDGITWTKSVINPVLTIGGLGEWDEGWTDTPNVIKVGSAYKMWYTGTSGDFSSINIGYATSVDGITWTKYGSNPVLSNGDTGTWDDSAVFTPNIIYNGINYEMWYAGGVNGLLGKGIGYAISDDGITWTKQGVSPVLNVGTEGEWDLVIDQPNVILNGEKYYMWYEGSLGADPIGLATQGGETPTPTPSLTPTPGQQQSYTSPSNNEPGPKGCSDETPGNKPINIYTAVREGENSIRLYFTDGDPPIDHYILEYGTSPGNYTFGFQNIGGMGTRSYLVNSLDPKQKYYFRIMAANGCATGTWSNEASEIKELPRTSFSMPTLSFIVIGFILTIIPFLI